MILKSINLGLLNHYTVEVLFKIVTMQRNPNTFLTSFAKSTAWTLYQIQYKPKDYIHFLQKQNDPSENLLLLINYYQNALAVSADNVLCSQFFGLILWVRVYIHEKGLVNL